MRELGHLLFRFQIFRAFHTQVYYTFNFDSTQRKECAKTAEKTE